MNELVLTTFDWVPEAPRGFVRDLRIRWALEEAGLPYRVASTPFKNRPPEHFGHQPFGQVPWLQDGELSIFESGAILLHLAGKSPALMPPDAQGRNDVTQWLFAALNSVEAAVLPWILLSFSGDDTDTPGRRQLRDFLDKRLGQMEGILGERAWLTGRFSAADILMADVLRVTEAFGNVAPGPACRAYIERATARPAFIKARADQLAHFARADAEH